MKKQATILAFPLSQWLQQQHAVEAALAKDVQKLIADLRRTGHDVEVIGDEILCKPKKGR